MGKIKSLKLWLNAGKFCSWNKNVHVSEESNDPEKQEHKIKIELFTDRNVYYITGIDRGIGKSYLGCIASRRAPLPGESHTRGNDLADGDFTFETWCQIVLDILSYEVLEIHKNPEPSEVIPMGGVRA